MREGRISGIAAWSAIILAFGCTGREPLGHQPRPKSQHKAPYVTTVVETPRCLDECMELRQHVRSGDYERVEAFYGSLDREMWRDCSREQDYQRALECFETTDESIGPGLDAWVEGRPNSWLALGCRAAHRLEMAQLLRTTRWSSEVSNEQWQGYEELSTLAEQDLLRALELNERFLQGYVLLLRTASHHADDQLLHAALRVAPWSYTVRNSYLWHLQPKWGGSLEAMDAFVEEARAESVWNPALEGLAELPAYSRAEGPWRAGNLKEAEAIFDRAIAETPTRYLYMQRGKVRAALGRARNALDDAQRALEISPCSKRGMELRLNTLFTINDGAAARSAADLLLALHPFDLDARWASSGLNFRQGRIAESAADMRVVTRFDPADGYAWNNLGFSLLELGEFADAEDCLTRSIELKNDTFVHTRYKRGKARYLQGKESAFEDLRVFVERKDEALKTHQQGGDTTARLAWAEKVLAAPAARRFTLGDEAPR